MTHDQLVDMLKWHYLYTSSFNGYNAGSCASNNSTELRQKPGLPWPHGTLTQAVQSLNKLALAQGHDY